MDFRDSWWNISVYGLVILAAAVCEISCGKTDRQMQTVPHDYRRYLYIIIHRWIWPRAWLTWADGRTGESRAAGAGAGGGRGRTMCADRLWARANWEGAARRVAYSERPSHNRQ